MKVFGNNRVTRALEAYYPVASMVSLAAIGALKFVDVELFRKFTDISYSKTMTREGVDYEHHQKGWNDAFFVFFCFNVVTVIRHLYVNGVLRPIARRLKMKKGLTLKFVDSGWFSLFYLVSTSWGIYICHDDEWWYNSHYFWKGYPHPFDYVTKQYYLGSLAFWLQCLVSFFFEAPRKDDGAFFFHHLITIALILGSYHFNFFRVGLAILLEQNAADILYYAAKMLNYAGVDRLSTATLVAFVPTWIYTRHFIFGWILYSLWFELPKYIYVPGWDPESGYYYVEWLWHLFSVALVSLQGLMIYWFFLILRVAYRVVTGQQKEDPTDVSDEEEEEGEKNGADVKKNKKTPKAMNGKANGTTVHQEKKKVK